MSKKSFDNLADTLGILTKGKIADPEDRKSKDDNIKKIVLKMSKDDHAALTRIALNEAAKMGKRYSLTELINDILKNYLETKKE